MEAENDVSAALQAVEKLALISPPTKLTITVPPRPVNTSKLTITIPARPCANAPQITALEDDLMASVGELKK